VLSMIEAPGHPHNAARRTFVGHDPAQPATTPRFDGTTADPAAGSEAISLDDALARWT
jgi:alpha-methylacyl-CoA racemase